MHLFFLFLKTVRPRRCGLCSSGQTISVALNKIFQGTVDFQRHEVLINLGTIDILKGADLYDMKRDYVQLIDACYRRGIQPIISTLAPIATDVQTEMNQSLLMFNHFLITRFANECRIVDLWSCFVFPYGEMHVQCYQQ